MPMRHFMFAMDGPARTSFLSRHFMALLSLSTSAIYEESCHSIRSSL